MTRHYKFSAPRLVLAILLLAGGGVLLACIGAYQYLRPDLPDVASLRDVELQVPLRVYSRDGLLIAQFGEQRRIPLTLEEIPPLLVNAVLAAEDDRFFAHHGVDYPGLLRATARHLMSGDMAEGGSTITMQLTRGIFLTPEKTYRRKLLEIFLTLRIEQQFTKQEILTLYLNRIFLGQRAYGVGAAAEVYFGKTMDQLELAEIALIAGLPQRPSRDNPVANPEYAKQRRTYVLRRLLENGSITQLDHDAATNTPVESKLHGPAMALEAPYIAEMARTELLAKLGPEIYTAGYRVVTTIDSRLQRAAVRALRLALLEYDQRHGYRGPAGHADLAAGATEPEWEKAVASHPERGSLVPAVVTALEGRSVTAYTRQGSVTIPWSGLDWARPATTDGGVGKAPENAAAILSIGDLIYVAQETAGTWRLMQVPDVEGAFVALDPQDGAVTALTGGFDYFASNYNRAVQARRQPGSAFKPFLYSAALEKGLTPATLINDAPIVFNDASLEASWRPQNVSREFYGPTRIREALVRSRNLVSIRILNDLGPAYATDYIQRFGFTAESLPQNLTLALGTAQVSPLEMAAGYAVFANGGFRVAPYFIERVEDSSGGIVFESEPRYACADCMAPAPSGVLESATATLRVNAPSSPEAVGEEEQKQGDASSYAYTHPDTLAPQVISPQNAYLMTDMMGDVVRRGTATRARALQRDDIGGKTGTTNDRRDAWFLGFSTDLVGAAWVGFDQERTLGPREEGARTALPMWVYFMGEALRGTPQHRPAVPPGLVTMRISPETGEPARPGDPEAIFETFIAGHVPSGNSGLGETGDPGSTPTEDRGSDALF